LNLFFSNQFGDYDPLSNDGKTQTKRNQSHIITSFFMDWIFLCRI